MDIKDYFKNLGLALRGHPSNPDRMDALVWFFTELILDRKERRQVIAKSISISR